MNIKSFDYKLPVGLIAQQPAKPRDHSRLLILEKHGVKIQHQHFYDLPDLLKRGDVLVLNETKVFPARLLGHKSTGGQVEIFLLKQKKNNIWQALIGGRHLKEGDKIYMPHGLVAEVVFNPPDKVKTIKFNYSGAKLNKLIVQVGQTPLPPYIKTKDSRKIRADYQTIFAKTSGSVAAPTAGLHFTKKLLRAIKNKGVKIYKITLHVAWGTFAPVKVTNIEEHKLHEEWVSIDKVTAADLNKLKKADARIIAVGTTTTRALEAMTHSGKLQSGSRWVNIYIYPGYKFKFIDSLITNFHLPQSSLLFLVSALAGRQNILQAYQIAVNKKYRFYSFGDAMFIK